VGERWEYRTTQHPTAAPVTAVTLCVLLFVLPGAYVAVADSDASVLLIGLALAGGIGVWLFRFWTVALVIDGDDLIWSSATHSRRIPLADLRRVYPSRGTLYLKAFLPGVQLRHRGEEAYIETTGRTLTVVVMKGFLPFLAALRERCPQLQVTSTRRWERTEAFGRRSHVSHGAAG
jgi:hypothetical protein